MTRQERDALMVQAVTLRSMLERFYEDLQKGVRPNTGGLHDYACAINDFPDELEKIYARLVVMEGPSEPTPL